MVSVRPATGTEGHLVQRVLDALEPPDGVERRGEVVRVDDVAGDHVLVRVGLDVGPPQPGKE